MDGGKSVKVEGSLELPITLGEKGKRKIVKQFFKVARIDAPYNAIFNRPLLNELNAVFSPKYLLMKFETNKGIASIKGNQIEAKRGYKMIGKMAM